MLRTTLVDEKNKLGLGPDREIEIQAFYTEHKGSGPTWGPRGGSPAEPAHVEITHVRVLNAPQSIEGDIIDVYGDEIERRIIEDLGEQAEAAEYDYDEDDRDDRDDYDEEAYDNGDY